MEPESRTKPAWDWTAIDAEADFGVGWRLDPPAAPRRIDRDAFRAFLLAFLLGADVLALGLNAYLFHHFRRTPLDLARGLWTFGPFGLFEDGTPPPLRLSDPSNFHAACGPECAARRGGAL